MPDNGAIFQDLLCNEHFLTDDLTKPTAVTGHLREDLQQRDDAKGSRKLPRDVIELSTAAEHAKVHVHRQ